MKHKLLPVLLLLLGLYPLVMQAQPETTEQHNVRMKWWRDSRFGMFIHWGLYAVPAGEWNGKTEYGEWIRSSAQIPLDTYNQFVPRFNPVDFDADAWVKLAKEAGMKYIVITSKHHDGFCMFNTEQTDFSIMSTPYKKDPMKKLAAACKKQGLTFCFYYSIMDWHHPDYLPRRTWEKDRPTEGADFTRYVEYMKAELKELLTNYGEIGVLWFDGEWENTWNEKYGKEIYAYCRSLRPDIIINNRVGAGRMDMEGITKEGMFGGDFGTPEQQIPATGLPGQDWETCMTMNDHWGYNSHDKNFKSSKELIRMLADIASKGGNYLLNVGPTDKGVIPPESVIRLKDMGKWMAVNGEAIYGTTASPFTNITWGRCTKKEIPGGVRLYLHVFDWPKDGILKVQGCLNDVSKAYVLSDEKQSALTVSKEEDLISIRVPSRMPDTIVTVVALEVMGELDITNPPVIKSDFNEFVDSLSVTIETDRKNVQIYYTLDGTLPSNNSTRYTGPILIKSTSFIMTRCYREGVPVSELVGRKFRKVAPLPAIESNKRESSGLYYRFYNGQWDSIPNYVTLIPSKQGDVPNFKLIPSATGEFYSVQYEGYINIPTTDVYKFSLGSDDGSTLYIDRSLLIENDGMHALKEKSETIPLRAGLHRIRVDYLQGTGGAELKVEIQGGALKRQAIPDSMLFWQ